jgi:uncharacterized membrane protein YjjP (DUF1212 family)
VSQPEAIGFILRLGRALHAYGYAAHRLEDVLAAVALQIGIEAQFFSTPTAISAAFGPQDDQRTFLIRVQPGDQDLGKLAQVDRVILEVLAGRLTPAEGSLRVEAIVAAPTRYGHLVSAIAFSIVSAAAGRFLGGGLVEIAIAGIIGLVTGLLAVGVTFVPSTGRIFEVVAAFAAAMITGVASVWIAPHSVFIATLAGLIVLIPGFTLTVALTELATRHLASGTARLAAAMVLFLGIIFGVALGSKVGVLLAGSPVIVEPVPLPLWTEVLALAVAPIGFAVLLRADPRDWVWVTLAGWVAFAGARLGGVHLGPELGTFVGAVLVGVASNVYALVMDRPSQIPLAPGVLLLVPGSIGFRSLASLLDRQVIGGVEAAFAMGLTATALVAGLLVGNILVPRRTSG